MKKYLVPYDFTPITRNALDHAIAMSRVDSGAIELLYIISQEKERAEAQAKFDELLHELHPLEVSIEPKIEVGSIFKDIARHTEKGDVALIVMGTHGAKGLQKVIGSKAIRVITSAQTPFIVTQSQKPRPIKNILIPVDLSKERIGITRFALDVAEKFKAKIHLVYQIQSDEFLAKRLRNNVTQVRMQLSKSDIAYDIHQLEPKKSLQNSVINYARDHHIDLIAFAHFPDSVFAALNNFSQELITNELGIPVLVVNASEITGVKVNYSFIGI